MVRAQKVKQNKTESKAMSQSKDKSTAKTKSLSKTKSQSTSKTKQSSSTKAKSKHIVSSASSLLTEQKQANSAAQTKSAVRTKSEIQTNSAVQSRSAVQSKSTVHSKNIAKTQIATTDTANAASPKVAAKKPAARTKRGTKAGSANSVASATSAGSTASIAPVMNSATIAPVSHGVTAAHNASATTTIDSAATKMSASTTTAKSKADGSIRTSTVSRAKINPKVSTKTSSALEAMRAPEFSTDMANTDVSNTSKVAVTTKTATKIATKSSAISTNKPTKHSSKSSTPSKAKVSTEFSSKSAAESVTKTKAKRSTNSAGKSAAESSAEPNAESATESTTESKARKRAKASAKKPTASKNKQAPSSSTNTAASSSSQDTSSVVTPDTPSFSNQEALIQKTSQHSSDFLMPFSAVNYNDAPTGSLELSENTYSMTEAMAALDNAWKNSAPYAISEYQLATEPLTHNTSDAVLLNTEDNDLDSFKTNSRLSNSEKTQLPDHALEAASHITANLQPAQGSAELDAANELALSEIKLFSNVARPESGITNQTDLQSSTLMQHHMQHYNAYSQQLVLLSQRNNLNQFSTEEQSTLINEYFSIFNNALNIIMLNSNERSIVEQALEEIMNYAAPVFEAEYKTFFYMCYSAAPRALFWMLQYPFYANFFMSKSKALSTTLPRRVKSSTPEALDEKIMSEVNSTLDTYKQLRQRFADLSSPMLSLHDNIMLSLYEEQNMLRQQISQQPKLTQRGRIRAIVKSGGKMPDDHIRMRLRQVNRQLFALHNLRLSEIRQMSMALEKLAHSPKRLSEIFGTDFKHFYMPQQLILQKLNSWTTMFPFSQQCLLVQLDAGFIVRSPRMPEVLYTQLSFKKQELIILDGLEVCYSPELCAAIAHQSDTLDTTPKGSAKQTISKSKSGARAKSEAVSTFDQEEINSSFKALSLKLKSLQDTPEWQSQSNNLAWTDPDFEDDTSSTLWEQDDKLSLSSLDELLLKTTTTQLLQPSDFQLEHWTDEHVDGPMDDTEVFHIDAEQESTISNANSAKQQSSRKRKRASTVASSTSPVVSEYTTQQDSSSPASYISGVFFGSQGAANPSQLQRFNERNLLVDGHKTGFMVVTL